MEYATSLGAHETVVFDLEDPKTWGPAMDGVTHLFSSTQDKYIAQHMAFAKWCGETLSIKTTLEHIVRISCFGADTNTNAYDADVHVLRAGAGIPLDAANIGGRRSASRRRDLGRSSRACEVTST